MKPLILFLAIHLLAIAPTVVAVEVEYEHRELFAYLLELEPSAREVQQAVIHYADVGNAKIHRWHQQSRLRALMPSVKFGRDHSRSNVVDLDRGSTSDSDVYISGPDEVEEQWDFAVEWDLSNLLFSSSQTYIDSRQRSMVQLRKQLLAEATQLYYERRRTQVLVLGFAAQSEKDPWSMRVRLDELTSLLDAMTGGFLSARLDELYLLYPEFSRLWLGAPSLSG
ncbi:MAG: hypothetical protein Q8R76_04650 [Candidatus Omnitrophota bacterium]|nr:hypothetical protein [Candidatus Omnitrophota bacterium]